MLVHRKSYRVQIIEVGKGDNIHEVLNNYNAEKLMIEIDQAMLNATKGYIMDWLETGSR